MIEDPRYSGGPHTPKSGASEAGEGLKALELLEKIAAAHDGCDDGYYACPRSADYFGKFELLPVEERPCFCWAERASIALAEARRVTPTGKAELSDAECEEISQGDDVMVALANLVIQRTRRGVTARELLAADIPVVRAIASALHQQAGT